MCFHTVCTLVAQWSFMLPCVFDACSSWLQDAATHCVSAQDTPIAFVGLFLKVLYNNEKVVGMSFPTRSIQAVGDVKKSTTWKVCLCVLYVCTHLKTLWFISVPFTSHVSSPLFFCLGYCMTPRPVQWSTLRMMYITHVHNDSLILC